MKDNDVYYLLAVGAIAGGAILTVVLSLFGLAPEKIEEELEITPEMEHLIFFAKPSKRGLCS